LFDKELDKRSAQILVVEDDDSTRLSICQFIKQNGYQPLMAENGKQALALLTKQVPDIILMDASMPTMDGFEAIEIIRGELELKQIPILMVTSHSDEACVNRAFEVGATEYISKPIQWTVLRNRLKYLWHSIRQNEISRLAAQVLENTNEGVIITDAKMTILTLNKAFCDITGYSAEEAIGQTPRLLKSGKNDKSIYRAMWSSLNEGGQWAGEIWNRRKNGEVYPEWLNISAVKNAAGLVTHYVGIFSDISLLKEKEIHLQQLANFDTLTGLANRRLFQQRFEHAIVQAVPDQKKVALLYIDLDGFKPINDTHGHDVGDSVLQIIAKRFQQTIRGDDTVCRLGGDEFGIILDDIKQADNAVVVANKLIQRAARTIVVKEKEMALGCSIGISIYPDHGEEPGSLLKLADVAMYSAKQAGKNQYRFCSDE